MGKLALRLAFLAMGINYTVLKLGEVLHRESPLFLTVAMCVPAVILGATSWWAVRCFARSWPVVLCSLIVVLGMLHAVERGNHRGEVCTAYVAMTLPMAALIVEKRCWWLCAKTYVYGNALALGLALWFEYQAHGIAMFGRMYRFGFLMSADGRMKLANPNVVGGQLALAAVLALILHLRTGVRWNPGDDSPDRPRRFSLFWTVFLSLGCVLTASRGAFFAWLGGILLLALGGMKNQQSSRLRELVAVSSILVATALFLATGTGITPWRQLQARFDTDASEVLTGSGRVLIWKAVFDAWRSNPRYFLIGAGTGAAPEALGRYLGLVAPNGITPGKVDAHNAFMEWLLSQGLVGIAAGLCLLVAVVHKARRMDRRDGSVNRQAILACFALASMTHVTFYQLSFVSAGALILSMLSEAPPGVPVCTGAPEGRVIGRWRDRSVRSHGLPWAPQRRAAPSG